MNTDKNKAPSHPSLPMLLTNILLAVSLAGCGVGGSITPTVTPPPPATATPPPFPKTIDLLNELHILSGDALTSAQDCPALLAGMPGGVILGLDAETCRVAERNNGTRAQLDVDIPAEYLGNVFILKIAWPNEGGRGLRAAAHQTASIRLDGRVIWEKSALTRADNQFFYAARSEPVLLTFVPGQPGKHKIDIALPAGMAWDLGALQLASAPRPQNMLGMAYSPYRDCQGPSTESQPGELEVRDDLYRLAQAAGAIRTYSATGINSRIPAIANELGIPVYAGAWLDGDKPVDNDEMGGIISIAQNARIEAAIIGNEYLLRHGEPKDADYLLGRIRDFKAFHFAVPVATAEIDSIVFKPQADGTPGINPAYKPILDEIDILLVHIYPFWAGLPAEGAAAYTVERFVAIKALLDREYGGKKRVIIGEAGWPDQGGPGYGGNYGQLNSGMAGSGAGPAQAAVFHPETQRQYLLELLALAQEKQVDLFYFDAFDELWKTEGVDGAGRSWGYAYPDRTLKYNFSSLLLPPEMLPAPLAGDVHKPYPTSAFHWGPGAYALYTEWPSHPTGKPKEIAFEPYAPAFMGNIEAISLDQCDRSSHGGETAMRVEYKAQEIYAAGEINWAGAYWLHPQDNWGTSELGNDVSAAKKLTFWARGAQGGETVEFVTGGICGAYDGKTPPLCPDSFQPRLSSNPVVLGAQWQQYAFDLAGRDRSNLVGAFGFAVSQIHNPRGAVFYIDDVTFSPEGTTAAETVYPAEPTGSFTIYSGYRSLENHYIPSNFMGDGETPGFLTLNLDSREGYQTMTSVIQVRYERGPLGWAGAYWTDPQNNWGQRPGGYDLTGVKRLTFWGRSDGSSRQLKILVGGIGCFKEKAFPYHDSVCDVVPIPWVTLTPQWQFYSIDLTAVKRDWTRLLGGFGFVTTKPGTFYLGDIRYVMHQ